jgi:hypothetical protein
MTMRLLCPDRSWIDRSLAPTSAAWETSRRRRVLTLSRPNRSGKS